MKPGLIVASVVLAGALAVVIWQGRTQWQQAGEQRAALLNVPVKALPVPPPAPRTPAEPVSAVKYAEVAEKNLFSKDRNPNVVIEQKPPQEEKKMPALPSIYGVIGLPSGVQALMTESKGGAGRPVRGGDTIGEFKIVALDLQNVTFGWNGKELSRKVDDLMDRSAGAGSGGPAAAPAAPAAGPAAPPPPPVVTSSNAAGKHGPIQVGTPMDPAFNCLGNDSSPAGTVDDGYRKQIQMGPFGASCKWVTNR